MADQSDLSSDQRVGRRIKKIKEEPRDEANSRDGISRVHHGTFQDEFVSPIQSHDQQHDEDSGDGSREDPSTSRDDFPIAAEQKVSADGNRMREESESSAHEQQRDLTQYYIKMEDDDQNYDNDGSCQESHKALQSQTSKPCDQDQVTVGSQRGSSAMVSDWSYERMGIQEEEEDQNRDLVYHWRDELKCTTCNENFTKRRSLTRHIATVHQQTTRYGCPQCSSLYTRWDNLQAHYRKRHPDAGALSRSESVKTPQTGHKPRQEVQAERAEVNVAPQEAEMGVPVSSGTEESILERVKGLSGNPRVMLAKIHDMEETLSMALSEEEKTNIRRTELEGKPVMAMAEQIVHVWDNSSRSVSIGQQNATEETNERAGVDESPSTPHGSPNLAQSLDNDRSTHDLKCFTCNKNFAYRRNLTRHIAMMHRQKSRYDCPQCSRFFTQWDNLKEHYRRQHPMASPLRSFQERSQEIHNTEDPSSTTNYGEELIDPLSRSYLDRSQKTTPAVCKSMHHDEVPSERAKLNGRTQEEAEMGVPLSLGTESILEQVKGLSGTFDQIQDTKETADPNPAKVLTGQIIQVVERSCKSVFIGQQKVTDETNERQYDVVFVRRPDKGHKDEYDDLVDEQKRGPKMSKYEIKCALIGNVKKITEKVTRSVYQGGAVMSCEEVLRIYEVHVQVAVKGRVEPPTTHQGSPYPSRSSDKIKVKCFTCNQYFAQRRNLDRHIAVMHGLKIRLDCPQCSRFFNRRDNLLAHYRKNHPLAGHLSSYLERSSKKTQAGLKQRRHDVQAKRAGGNVAPQEVKMVVSMSSGTDDSILKQFKGSSGNPQATFAQNHDRKNQSSTTQSEEELTNICQTQVEGKPVTAMDPAKVLAGQMVRVGESSSRSVFIGQQKVTEETKVRQYDVVFVLRPNEESNEDEFVDLYKVDDGRIVGRQMCKYELQRALIGNVKEITEKVMRSVYQGGALVSCEEDCKTYEVPASWVTAR